MAATAPKPKPPPKRRQRPRRRYVVEDSTPADTPDGEAAFAAWLLEEPKG